MSGVRFFQAKEIAPRTWQIEYAFAANERVYCYLTEGRDYALAIDTILGYGNLRAFMESLTEKPVKLVNTHFHFDHCGGNFAFDSCYIHPADLPYFYSEQPLSAAPPSTARSTGRRASSAPTGSISTSATIRKGCSAPGSADR